MARLVSHKAGIAQGLEVSMEEQWKNIREFPGYRVSNLGRVVNAKTRRVMRQAVNQYGVSCVGLMREGVQYHRSVPLLVLRTFTKQPAEAFDTPINLDGDRQNNTLENLDWRPRWFAVEYNRQFQVAHAFRISGVIMDLKTHVKYYGSLDVVKKCGVLEKDVVLAIPNRTYVWPTYQLFGMAAE